MKKIVLGLSLFAATLAYAQNGLEKIIVEKYYVTNAADSTEADQEAADFSLPVTKNVLPVGSTTYRVYADMLPGYKLLSIYADAPHAHKLIFRTTTSFYNHPEGDNTPATTTKAKITNSLRAIDSYFTLGSVCTTTYGILKKDDDGQMNTITVATNPAGVLLNNTPEIGVPLTTQDGMITGGATIVKPALGGFTNELDPFGDGTIVGDTMVFLDGSIYTTAGAVGPVPADNRVLIAQLTTKGKLTFHLNVLVQAPDGKGEFYVSSNPQQDVPNQHEIYIPSLNYPDTTVVTDIPNFSSKTNNEVLFSVYPNPVNDHVTLELIASEPNSKGSYTIYGIIGNVITHKELNGINGNYKEVVDMSLLAKGLYTIQMNVNGISSAKKIIKN
jgi:hypothetical protein